MDYRNCPTGPWISRLAGLLAFLLGVTSAASAEQVRVASSPASVTEWRMAGQTLATLPVGTLLEVLDQDAGYYWVMLPPDSNGTHRSGWISASRVEPLGGTAEASASGTAQMPGSPAQPVPAPAGRTMSGPRWQLQAIGGATFSAGTSPFAGGAVAFALSPALQLSVEAGRMDDISTQDMHDFTNTTALRTSQLLTLATGRPYTVDGETSMSATYGMVGLRYVVNRNARSRPYVGGHAGLSSVNPEVQLLIDDSDVTRSFLSPSQLPEEETHLLSGLEGGLTIQLTRKVGLDLGYRYSRLFADEGVNIGRLHVALGMGF